MAKLWEYYAKADKPVKGWIDSRVRDIANALTFEELPGVSAKEIMRRLYNVEITPERLDKVPDKPESLFMERHDSESVYA